MNSTVLMFFYLKSYTEPKSQCFPHSLTLLYASQQMFDSIDDIIKFHMLFPIHLINGKDLSDQRRCVLTRPPTREEMVQLLD